MRTVWFVLLVMFSATLDAAPLHAATAGAHKPRSIWLTLGPVVTWESFPEVEPGMGRGGSFGFITDAGGFEATMVQSFHDLHPLAHTVPGKQAEYLLISAAGKIGLLRHGPVRPYVSVGGSLIDFNGHDALDTPGMVGDIALRGRALFAKAGVDVLLAHRAALDVGALVSRVADMRSVLGLDVENEIGQRLEGTSVAALLQLTLRL